jgi:hypothetical protein
MILLTAETAFDMPNGTNCVFKMPEGCHERALWYVRGVHVHLVVASFQVQPLLKDEAV